MSENLNHQEQLDFGTFGITFLRNISDKFKRPIVLRQKSYSCPKPLTVSAIQSGDFVAVPQAADIGLKASRAISGREMSDRYKYLASGNGYELGHNEQTYKNVDRYLKDNDINSLVYAEYAVQPETKSPNLKTAIKEFCADTRFYFDEIRKCIK